MIFHIVYNIYDTKKNTEKLYNSFNKVFKEV